MRSILFFIGLLFLSESSTAQVLTETPPVVVDYGKSKSWFPVGKEDAKTTYASKVSCEEAESQLCFDVAEKNLDYYDLVESEVDNPGDPILRERYKVTACDGISECGVAIQSLNLPEGDHSSHCDQGQKDYITFGENKLLPGWSFYCTGIIGYNKITVKKLKINADKKATYDAKVAADAARSNLKGKVFQNMAFGRDLKAEIALINATRGLTSAQITSFVDTFQNIDRLLDAGSIETAKEAINGLTPDEELLRAEDKNIILQRIDVYLTSQ